LFYRFLHKTLNSLAFIIISWNIQAQYLVGFHSEWDDSFREWEIEAIIDSVKVVGSMDITWSLDNDFSEWNFRIENINGIIKQRWNQRNDLWELRMGDQLVMIRQTWPEDPTQWTITSGKEKMSMRTVNNLFLDEWENQNKENGDLYIYTEVQGDPRDWIIEDYPLNNTSFAMRMASVFIAIYSSIPKQ